MVPPRPVLARADPSTQEAAVWSDHPTGPPVAGRPTRPRRGERFPQAIRGAPPYHARLVADAERPDSPAGPVVVGHPGRLGPSLRARAKCRGAVLGSPHDAWVHRCRHRRLERRRGRMWRRTYLTFGWFYGAEMPGLATIMQWHMSSACYSVQNMRMENSMDEHTYIEKSQGFPGIVPFWECSLPVSLSSCLGKACSRTWPCMCGRNHDGYHCQGNEGV